jgi:hypothetical protein
MTAKEIPFTALKEYPIDDVTELFIEYAVEKAKLKSKTDGKSKVKNVNNRIVITGQVGAVDGPQLKPLKALLAPYQNHILTLFLDPVVHLPAGTVIYRGQTDAFTISPDGKKAHLTRRILSTDRHTYFGLRPLETTVNYGITARFTLAAPLRVLNITDVATYTKLKAQMESLGDTAAVKALMEAFPLRNGRVIRHSQKKYDFAVLDFLCANTPFEGYIQPRMVTVDGGHMHAELAVCAHKTVNILDAFGQQAIQPPEGMTYGSLYADYRMRLIQQQRRSAREQSRRRHAARAYQAEQAPPPRLRFKLDAQAEQAQPPPRRRLDL